MKQLRLALLFAFLAAPLTVFAQVGSLTGTVTDARTGDPLPGATVYVTSTDQGTVTDIDGRYVIANIPTGNVEVRFTYVGFRSVTRTVAIPAGASANVNIALQEDVLGLEDVVVIGYTTVPKRELTGSIASIRARDIETLNIQSVDQALQGQAAGVRVTNLSGQPGGDVHIRIRGLGSINASNAPLFVVDGVPISSDERSSITSQSPLQGINPQDIASIEILKDAAAASIYGAQASNGVVLVTTKRGSAGATRFNVSSSIGTVQEQRRHDLIEAPEWVEMQRESFLWWAELTGRTPAQGLAQFQASTGLPADQPASEFTHYDWQDALMRTGVNRRMNVSASGGTQQTRFFVSGGSEYEEGTGIGTDFSRINLRTNLDHRVSDLLSFEVNTNLARTEGNGALADGFFLGSPFYAGQRNRPTDPIYTYDEAGNITGYNHNTFNNYNAVEFNEVNERVARTNSVLATGAAVFNLIEGLTFRSFYGLDYRNNRDVVYNAPETTAGSPLGFMSQNDRQVINFTTNQVFNYRGRVGGFPLSGLAGFEYRHQDQQYMFASAEGFPSGLFRTMQNAADPVSVTSYGTEFKLASVFGQAKYDLLERYLISATARYDGSSRFGEANRWGLFYSASAAWVMTNEPFLQGVTGVFDDLKLRVSHGVTGNTAGISNFASWQLFGSGGTYLGQPGLRPSSIGNIFLTWEGAQTTNLGLDWAIRGGRLYGAIDVYRRDTKDLLMDRSLPNDAGFTSVTENVGSIRNEGIELELGAILVETAGFQWTSDFNVTFHRNEILELMDDADHMTIGGALYFRGRSLGDMYMYRWAGANPADGLPMYYDVHGNITYSPTASRGGEPLAGDRQFVGSNLPSAVGGWNNRFSYQGVSLDVLFQYNFGQYTYDAFMGSFTDGAFWRRGGLIANSRDRWTEPGQITSVERAYVNSAYSGRTSGFVQSTRFMQDASYVRLKNIRVAYALPPRLANNIGLHRASIFVQGTNIATWTNYTGIDPEVVGTNDAVYPQPRAYTTGIEIGF
jgi:TonB-dependent starch-binding outer membrane protein SusC